LRTGNDGAVAIDTGLTVTDAGSPNLASATVAITANFQTAEDVLAFTNQNGIGSFNSTTGVLTLTRLATVAQCGGAAVGDVREHDEQPDDSGADDRGRGQRRDAELRRRGR
jgi:hypothetical protein